MSEIDWTKPRLLAKGIRKQYDDRQVLGGVDLEVYPGQIVALIGSSGSGKSTLLRCINLIEQIDDGQIWLEGDDISRPGIDEDFVRQQIGLVFQSFNLFAHLSILENITLAPIKVQGKSTEEARIAAKALLSRFDLADKADQYPDRLSGGQQQRVAIARALVNHPKVILADEPTGNLDRANATEVMKLLHTINEERGTTMVIVTHDHFVADFADRSIELIDGTLNTHI